MKTAFLFSGQGAQHLGMGKELYDKYACVRNIFDHTHIDFDVKQLCFEGTQEQLDDTQYAQACIFVMSMACAEVLKEHGVVADVCAGLSLGEYSAFAYGGTFSIQDGTAIVRERGKLMAHALPAGTTSMAAVMMLDEMHVKEACKEVCEIGVCEIANYNCPGQIVITGDKKAVVEAGERCIAKGARRVIPLQVSGAFHSSLLHKAGEQLRKVLGNYELHPSTIPVYNNISGNIEKIAIIDILSKQISSSVYFEQTIAHMLEDGVDTFIEVGPGKAISGFVKKCTKGMDVKVLHVEDIKSLTKTLDAIN